MEPALAARDRSTSWCCRLDLTSGEMLAIVDVAKPLGIAVHDHIIVGKDGHASLKGLKLI